MAPKKADKKPAAAKTTKAAAKKGGKKRAKVRGEGLRWFALRSRLRGR